MSGVPTGSTWVFHRGALGDSVLLWPRLRAMVRAGRRVVLVTDAAKARLAERELGITGLDAEQPRFNRLWVQDSPVAVEPSVAEVLDAVSGGNPFVAENLHRMFPGAAVRALAPPRGGAEAARWAQDHPLSAVALRFNEGGPVVLHAGAGSRGKRWPIERWSALAAGLGREARLIAGEVEAEQFRVDERSVFSASGGRYLGTLDDLAAVIGAARLFVGCDSGPAHLAAQLGVPTLALFGPTDPALWAPIGPMVRTIGPGSAQSMEWLDAADVLTEAGSMLGSRLG